MPGWHTDTELHRWTQDILNTNKTRGKRRGYHQPTNDESITRIPIRQWEIAAVALVATRSHYKETFTTHWSSTLLNGNTQAALQRERMSLDCTDPRNWWTRCRITTLQPKWHVTFVGHLFHQVKQHQGLADKNDDIIEKAHQPWKREKERTWNIKNFQLQQRCQLKSVRKRSHYKVCTKMAELEIKRRRRYSNEMQNPTTTAVQSNKIKRAAKAAKRLDFNVDVPDSSSSDDTE